MNEPLDLFWSAAVADVLLRLQTTDRGLTSADAKRRLDRDGPNVLQPRKRGSELFLLLGQFKSPLILILLFAAALSSFLHDATDALIILGIVLASGMLGFWQERGAAHAVDKLLAVVQTKATALRDGAQQEIPVAEVVPGDVVFLSAGKSIPGDCLVLESKDLFLDEATLTGETYPVAKKTGTTAPDAPLGQRANTLFMGTHVVSGSAAAVVVRTGTTTEFGKVAERLRLRSPETEFERGVRRFGYLLMEVTLVLVIAIFAINVYFQRPVLEAFIFSLAVAVGLTPQLLPAIISINLAHGAKRMARGQVIVRRLSSIENFGSMNVLCCDKTGTLTEGVVRVRSALNLEGQESEEVLRYAYLNAFFETGLVNPIDEAIRTHRLFDLDGCRKLDELPYDFIRKRLSVLVADHDQHVMVTKGALAEVLAVCSTAKTAGGADVPIATVRDQIATRFADLSGQGFRTLGVAYRDVGSDSHIIAAQESDLVFSGLLVLYDPPKAGIGATIEDLRRLGVFVKMITGDNRLVAAHTG
jgi:Mg2+-importing ATPase